MTHPRPWILPVLLATVSTLLLDPCVDQVRAAAPGTAKTVLLEAEAFQEKGGWAVDQQFVHQMGSPYLLAHGWGNRVANAKTTASFPAAGAYRVWVRTRNWVPGKWAAPGQFRVHIDGKPLSTVFGTQEGWAWQDGGTVQIAGPKAAIELEDLTGFDGRCDALCFTQDLDSPPPNDPAALSVWRKQLLGVPAVPPSAGAYDLVIVGGGISGCAAALAADQCGLKVALLQDRPVLGGNASSEVRVHTLGIYGHGETLLKQIDTEHWPNGSAKAIPDEAKRHSHMQAAKNVTIYFNWRASGVQMQGNRILAVDAAHTESGQTLRFQAPVFIDCTGDGWIGHWAGAESRYGREPYTEFGEEWDKHGELWSPAKPDRRVMGTSVLWYTEQAEAPSTFPEVPWALPVAKDKPAVAGEWYWEFSDNDKHQIDDAEAIRDHMLRAIYGSFANAKKDPKYANYRLAWVGYVGGKRESRRLVGDYIYTMQDAATGREFPDAVVQEKREIDVHYQRILDPKTAKGDDRDFLSKALFYKTPLYHIPFRCLYSKNIENLMMAGRCFSCSHVGLGGPRVMRTCGQMGLATGYAASLCKKHNTGPRGVYQKHIAELLELVRAGSPAPAAGSNQP